MIRAAQGAGLVVRAEPVEARTVRFDRLRAHASQRGSLSSFLCKRLLILWLGRGSSAVNGVPVLAALKPGRWVRLAGLADRGCAPAGLAWMEEPRRLSSPAGHRVISSRPGKARLSAP